MRLYIRLSQVLGFVGLLAGSLLLAGCTTPSGEPVQQGKVTVAPTADPIKVGDKIRIDLTGSVIQNSNYEEQVKEDGTINLPFIEPMDVRGKTPREIEEAIFKSYVPQFYKKLTVTVTPLDRYYHVGGQVNRPGEQRYNGSVTVTRAIQSAGDFTEFGNRKNIQLIRINGKKIVVNYWKILEKPELDPQVYPGDKIEVPRRTW